MGLVCTMVLRFSVDSGNVGRSVESHPNIGSAVSRPGVSQASPVAQKCSSLSETHTPHSKCSSRPMIGTTISPRMKKCSP